MTTYLIEVDHAVEPIACAHAVKVFLASGSHFLTYADWGCQDGVQGAWVTVEVAEARPSPRQPATQVGATPIAWGCTCAAGPRRVADSQALRRIPMDPADE